MHDEAVAGITLEQYAEVTARAVRLNVTAIEAASLVLGDHVTPATWQAASSAWRARMEISAEVRARYTARYAEARARR